MKKLLIKIKPNKNSNAWYYNEKHKNLINQERIVYEFDDEPVFTNHYRLGIGGTYFINKNDCEIIKEYER